MSVRKLDIATVALPCLLMLALVAGAALTTSDSVIPRLTRDISAVAGVHPLSGALSSLGTFIWFATGSILIFSSYIAFVEDRQEWKFLATGSVVSVMLWFDDFFLFHEFIAPFYFGIREKIVIAFTGVAILFYLAIFRKYILARGVVYLGLSIAFLGGSALVDQLPIPIQQLGGWSFFVEDGLKWIGIVTWARYHVALALASVSMRSAASRDRAPLVGIGTGAS